MDARSRSARAFAKNQRVAVPRSELSASGDYTSVLQDHVVVQKLGAVQQLPRRVLGCTMRIDSMKTTETILPILLSVTIACVVGCRDTDDDDTSADDDVTMCDDDTDDPDDADGDGWTVIDGDCDDGDPAVHPGADDVPCDGVDQDCNGAQGAYVGDAPFTTIQSAIDSAVDGDTVAICPGTNYERIAVSLQDNLHLTSWSGDAEGTVLDGGGRGPILTVGDLVDEIRIDRLTFRNAVIIDSEVRDGGAIHSNATSLTIEDCVFCENQADDDGGAIYHSGSVAKITGSSFSSNHTGNGGYGGAIAFDGDHGAYEVRDTVFSANTAGQDGGGLHSHGEHSIELESTSFLGNVAEYAGGAVALETSGLTFVSIVNSTLESNTAGYEGGGISFYVAPSTSMEVVIGSTIFLDNYASYEGGAVSWGGSGASGSAATFLFEDSSFEENASNAGGAIGIHGPSITSSVLLRSTFTGNSSEGMGGAVSIEAETAAEILFRECGFRENKGGAVGGAIHVCGSEDSSPFLVAFENTVLDANEADSWGGGVNCSGDQGDVDIHLSGSAVTSNGIGAVRLNAGCALESTDVDWGSEGTDNYPWDIDTDGEIYDGYEDSESFTCVGGGICS